MGHWLCLYKFVNSTLAVLCETWFQASNLQRFMQSPRSKVQCQHPVCRPFAFVPKNQTELVQRLQNCKDTTRIHKVYVMYAPWAVFVLDVSMSCRLIGLIYLPGTSRTMQNMVTSNESYTNQIPCIWFQAVPWGARSTPSW